MNREYEYETITAYDPRIRRRTVHVVQGKEAISLATGHKFNLSDKELRNLKGLR